VRGTVKAYESSEAFSVYTHETYAGHLHKVEHQLHSLSDGVKWQRNKLFSLALACAACSGLVLCVGALFTPHINDALSGRPSYLAAIADVTAEGLVKQLSGLYPVIVAKHEHLDCAPIEGSVRAASVYYVIRFSETRHRLCVTKYVDVVPRENARDAIINEQTGRNFGPPLTPVHVVAVGQNVVDFPDTFLSSLHWRQRTEPATTNSDQALIQDLQQLSIDISALKTKISHRHRMVNRRLTVAASVTLLIMVYISYGLRVQFVSMRQLCSLYGGSLTFMTFLANDPDRMLARTRRSFIDKQTVVRAVSRADRIARRRQAEMRSALAACLETLTEREARLQIQDCLIRDSYDEMKALLDTLVEHSRERSPNERLDGLLEYLKEYCTHEEIQALRLEAVAIMQRYGFRSARTHVVNISRDLRLRALQAEQDQLHADQGPHDRMAAKSSERDQFPRRN
jgi:hypothetical protein